jgi:hypothetical protein
MLIANAIIKVADQFGTLMCQVTAVAGYLTVEELSSVLIPIIEIHEAFPGHHSFLEVTFVNARLVV